MPGDLPPSPAARARVCLVFVFALLGLLSTAAHADCGSDPAAADIIAALFDTNAVACDANHDGAVGAADVTAVLIARATPLATATPTSSPTPSPSGPPTATPSATPSPTASPTPTSRVCPTAGAALLIAIDNQAGVSPITVEVSGVRLGQECIAGTLLTSYDMVVECIGTGITTCAQPIGLAPGSWRHTIRVSTPDTQQLQHQASLLIAGSSPNRVRFTAFATVLSVRTTQNTGAGSLRRALTDAAALAKPALIQFDPAMFPDGNATAIQLDSQLPALAANDVTIDGTDALGEAGNRIIDAVGLPIPALAITGARNHIIGMELRNSGEGNRDVVNISGMGANGNVIERSIVTSAASGDGIGVDLGAGSDFGDNATVIRDCEIRGASDKGIKVTRDAHARVERSWVHDNANGGIQATLGGHVQATDNLVEDNRGSTAQNGLSVNARDDNETATVTSELISSGNISRRNGANGMSVRAAIAAVHDDYLAVNGSSGIRVFNDVGAPATARVEGTSAVCNLVDGAVVANTSVADFGGGGLGSPGNNAFTQNNLPAGGANLRNATAQIVDAENNQWEHCGPGTTCNDDEISRLDLSNHGVNTSFMPTQAHRSQRAPVVTAVSRATGRQGDLLRIFGVGFNVIDGHFAENQCADVAGRNRCVPLRGNCVKINKASAPVEAVTPTMLVVRWPFTCIQSTMLTVTIDQGAGGTTSNEFPVCTNDAP